MWKVSLFAQHSLVGGTGIAARGIRKLDDDPQVLRVETKRAAIGITDGRACILADVEPRRGTVGRPCTGDLHRTYDIASYPVTHASSLSAFVTGDLSAMIVVASIGRAF
jgi:hypothetical protein